MKSKQEQLISRGYLAENAENCYSTNIQSDLIRWKIIRAMSGFSESEPFLQEQKLLIRYDRLQKEIDRSLSLIKIRD